MIKYIIAVPIALVLAFLLGGVLSHFPVPFSVNGGRKSGEVSYRFYLGAALFAAFLSLGVVAFTDGYGAVGGLFWAVSLGGAGLAFWGCVTCGKVAESFGEGAKLSDKGGQDCAVSGQADDEACCLELDEIIEVGGNSADVSCGDSYTKGCGAVTKDVGCDDEIGNIMRFKNYIVDTINKNALFISVILCACLVIFLSCAMVFANVFRPMDGERAAEESVVFTEAQRAGDVLLLYTEKPDVIYAVFGYGAADWDHGDFLSRIGDGAAYTVSYFSLDRDEWSAYNAVQTISDADGRCLLTAESSAAARNGAVSSTLGALFGVCGLLAVADSFCFYLYFARVRKKDKALKSKINNDQ